MSRTRPICWRDIVNDPSEAVLATDGAGVITFTNDRAGALFGLDPASIGGRSIAELIPGADHLIVDVRAPRDAVRLYGIRTDSGEFPLELSVARQEGGETPIVVLMVRHVDHASS